MLFLYFLGVLLVWYGLVVTHKYTIVNTSGPYLTRYYPFGQLLRRWFNVSVFIHHFHQSDQRELHSHPWLKSYSLILWGGYRESRSTVETRNSSGRWIFKRTFPPLSINKIEVSDFHFVELLDEKRGCWTLFFAGNNPDQEWGFLLEDGTYESANDRFDSREEALSGD